MRLRGLTIVAAFGSLWMGIVAIAWAEGGPDGGRWWSHVWSWPTTSSRAATPAAAGHRKAAEYVAREFERAGLKPAGTDGYFQPVRLISREIDESHSSLALIKDSGARSRWSWARMRSSARGSSPAPSLEAALVFAGYGLSIPEAASRRLRGAGRPRQAGGLPLRAHRASIPGPLAAHMQSAGERAALLEAAGGGRHRSRS